MKEGESINDYFTRTLSIANKMSIHVEDLKDLVVIDKILHSMTRKFIYMVCNHCHKLDNMNVLIKRRKLVFC